MSGKTRNTKKGDKTNTTNTDNKMELEGVLLLADKKPSSFEELGSVLHLLTKTMMDLKEEVSVVRNKQDKLLDELKDRQEKAEETIEDLDNRLVVVEDKLSKADFTNIEEMQDKLSHLQERLLDIKIKETQSNLILRNVELHKNAQNNYEDPHHTREQVDQFLQDIKCDKVEYSARRFR